MGRSCMPDPNDPKAHGVFSFGPFTLRPAERLLQKVDEKINVGSRALDILIALVERAGEVVTRQELMSRVWPGLFVDEVNLRVNIAALRKAIGDEADDARYLANVPGRGYCFVVPVTRSASPFELSGREQRKLPAQLSRLIGRDETVRDLSSQLSSRRLVSIVGPGGMGKTTVAISVAHELFDVFHGAVFFVDLDALSDPQLVPTAVASALGFMIQAQDPLNSLLSFLDDKKVLMVLDSCEHVIDTAATLADRIVKEAPQARILVTSREALRVDGEHVHLLHALACPPEIPDLTAAEALEYPAVQLFMERAEASGYVAGLTDADAPIVAGLCRSLDGIALAIELAASRTPIHGIRETGRLLDNRFKMLWQGRRTALPRHQTLSAMLDWSYNLLSDHEKDILIRLAVFMGDFTLEAASSVLSEIDGDEADITFAIADLVSKSLVSARFSKGLVYYRLLETTRAYAAAKLAERGETDRVARRHAISYSAFLQHDTAIQSTLGEYDLSGYAPHVGNVRAALEWATSDHGDIGIGVKLATWAAPLFIGLSLLDECRRWCERALQVLDESDRGTRQEMILQESFALSSMFTRGSSDEVRAAIGRGLVLAEAFEERAHQLQLLAGLHIYLTRTADVPSALATAEKGRAIAQAAKNPAGLIMMESMLGISNHLSGDQAKAQFHCEKSMTYAAEVNTFNTNFFGFDHPIFALVPLSRALWLRGLSDQALRTAQRAIDEATKRGHPVSLCYALTYCSSVYFWTGDLATVSDFVQRLISHSGQYSLHPYHAAGIALKGELAIVDGELESGLELLRSSVETLGTRRHAVLIAAYIRALAEGLLKNGLFEEALFTVNGAIARITGCGEGALLAELLRTKALILSSMSSRDYAAAIACLQEAIAIARRQSTLALELRSATALARLHAENKTLAEARNVLAPVYERFTEGFETSDLRTARQLLAELG
jgi:predicted ATPase